MNPRLFFRLSAILCALFVSMPPVYSAKTVLTGEICDARVHKLSTQIEWYDNLHKAEAEAQQDGKLIFWMHMLGHIDGAT
jgi:hypothetical protein